MVKLNISILLTIIKNVSTSHNNEIPQLPYDSAQYLPPFSSLTNSSSGFTSYDTQNFSRNTSGNYKNFNNSSQTNIGYQSTYASNQVDDFQNKRIKIDGQPCYQYSCQQYPEQYNNTAQYYLPVDYSTTNQYQYIQPPPYCESSYGNGMAANYNDYSSFNYNDQPINYMCHQVSNFNSYQPLHLNGYSYSNSSTAGNLQVGSNNDLTSNNDGANTTQSNPTHDDDNSENNYNNDQSSDSSVVSLTKIARKCRKKSTNTQNYSNSDDESTRSGTDSKDIKADWISSLLNKIATLSADKEKKERVKILESVIKHNLHELSINGTNIDMDILKSILFDKTKITIPYCIKVMYLYMKLFTFQPVCKEINMCEHWVSISALLTLKDENTMYESMIKYPRMLNFFIAISSESWPDSDLKALYTMVCKESSKNENSLKKHVILKHKNYPDKRLIRSRNLFKNNHFINDTLPMFKEIMYNINVIITSDGFKKVIKKRFNNMVKNDEVVYLHFKIQFEAITSPHVMLQLFDMYDRIERLEDTDCGVHNPHLRRLNKLLMTLKMGFFNALNGCRIIPSWNPRAGKRSTMYEPTRGRLSSEFIEIIEKESQDILNNWCKALDNTGDKSIMTKEYLVINFLTVLPKIIKAINIFMSSGFGHTYKMRDSTLVDNLDIFGHLLFDSFDPKKVKLFVETLRSSLDTINIK